LNEILKADLIGNQKFSYLLFTVKVVATFNYYFLAKKVPQTLHKSQFITSEAQ